MCNRNARQSIFIVLILVLLSGCAGNLQKFNEPESGPRARVRFASTADEWVTLYSYDDKECKNNEQEWMQLYGNYILSGDTNPSLGMPLPLNYQIGTVKEVYVSTGRPYYFMFQSAKRGAGPERITETYVTANKGILDTAFACGTPFTMEFEEGNDYEIVFHFYGLGCSVDVFNLAKDSDGKYRRSGMELPPIDVEPCKPVLQKMRW